MPSLRRRPSLGPVALACLACAALPAAAEGGLKLPAGFGLWPAWPSSLHLSATALDNVPRDGTWLSSSPPGARAPAGLSLTGDYYFLGDRLATPDWRSGLRASSVLLVRQPGVSVTDLALSSRAIASGSSLARPLGAGALHTDTTSESYSTLPYLGIGYSGMSVKSGWGFWADVGLVVQSPGGALGLGRVLAGSQGVDELLRELRLAPMLQLGVNYAF